MCDCKTKRKHTCGKKIQAVCTYYESYIPESSELHDSDCKTIEETTEDLYHITEDIKDNINLEDLGSDCLDYEEEEVGKIKVREVLKKHEEEICLLKESVGDTDGINFDISDIDTACLVDECGTGFSDLKSLLQAMINKICDCCNN
ncbi:MAG: hypothetical protein KC414_09245 [Romboutsia sp.]|nr:hypothetical protein [Romboutsia sp.]